MDARIFALVSDLPGWLEALAWAAYTGVGIYVLGLVAVTLIVGEQDRGVLRDLLGTAITLAVVCVLGSSIVRGTFPDVIPEISGTPSDPAFPAFRVALVTAVLTTLAPHLALPVRSTGRYAIAAVALSSVLLELTALTGVASALLAGALSVSLVRVAFGSPEALLPLSRLNAVLARVGVETAELSYVPQQVGRAGTATGVTADGRDVLVKVYGRDAADAQRAERLWQSLWYRRTGPWRASGRLHQVEHEALGITIAGRLGLDVGDLVAVGEDESGDAVLVATPPAGRPIGEMDPTAFGGTDLDRAWRALAVMQSSGFVHGALGPTTILVANDTVGFTGLESSSLTGGEVLLAGDVAAMLCTTAGIVGIEEAVEVAVATVGTDALVAATPYVQLSALSVRLRDWLSDLDLDVDDVRNALVERLDAEAPELVQLRRVTLGGIVMVVFAVVAANAIVSQIAEIGLDTLLDELAGASVGWLVAALLLKLSSYPVGWLSMKAVITEPVPLGPTTLLQSAKSFVGLVVPSTVGRAAMDVRFLQKLGTPISAAIAQGPLISIAGFFVEMALLLLTAGSVADSISGDGLLTFDSGGLVLIAVCVAAAAVGVVVAIPRLRELIVPHVVEAFRAVRATLTSPRRLIQIFGAEALDRVIGALSLAAVLVAFDSHVTFTTVVFVSVASGFIAGVAPVPGGVGVAEAVLTGLLTAVGVPSEQAFAVAITYRVVTSYLPPVFGFFSLRWLTKERYL